MERLFAVTGDDVVRIERQGDEWVARSLFPGSGAQCLALNLRQPSTLYVGSASRGVWRSEDAGETWEDAHLPQPAVFSVAVSPVDGSVYAGCEPSMLFRSADDGRTWVELAALRQLPSAPTWSFPPRPWTSHVRWIAPSPHDAAVLIVGIELGGLMYSADHGNTWADHRPGAQRDVHALAWHPRVSGRAYEAGGGGPAWSHDGGWTWKPLEFGLQLHYTWGLAVDPENPDRWYVSASPGPMQAHSGRDARALIYRWQDQGPWTALHGGLPIPLTSLPYALATTAGWLLAGLGDGRIYASRDGGDTFEQLRLRGDPLPRVVALAVVESS